MPYPNNNAIGYSFAIPITSKLPPSLQIISDELERCGYSRLDQDNRRTLNHWTNQGVFLLNRSLTCERGGSNTHAKQWAFFTESLVKFICSKRDDIVWLLWGNNAKELTQLITNDTHYILTACHPIAERFSAGKLKFTSCNHFILTNGFLEQKDKKPIEW